MRAGRGRRAGAAGPGRRPAGPYDESERIGIEALTLFRQGGPYPDGPAGAMPAGWGLPILDPARIAALRAWSDATEV